MMDLLEITIQELIQHNPYIIDDSDLPTGTTERQVKSGRIDIYFETPNGVVVVECKRTALRNKDVLQLRGYIEDLFEEGKKVIKAYLVGMPPNKPLKKALLEGEPNIDIKELIKDVPIELSRCDCGRYSKKQQKTCLYCGRQKRTGDNIYLERFK